MPAADKANDTSGMNKFLDELAQFVREGHGLMIFCGDKVIPKDYNKALSKHGLLALPLVEKKDGQDVREASLFSSGPLYFSRKTFNLPAFERFKEDKNYQSFITVKINRAFEVNEDIAAKKKLEEEKKQKADEDKKAKDEERARQAKEWDEKLARLSAESKALLAREVKSKLAKWVEEDRIAGEKANREKKKLDPLTVVLRYNNPDARADRSDQQPGMPAVISRKIGKGEVFFITTSADMGPPDEKADLTFSWNDWANSSCYPTFVQDSVNYLLHGTTQEYNLQAGDSLTWFPPDAENRVYTLVHPIPALSSSPERKVGEEPKPAEQERLGSAEADDVTSGRPTVKANRLYSAGIYTMKGTLKLSKDELVPENSLRLEEISSPLAVTPDLTESENLDCFKPSELDDFLEFKARQMVAGEAAPESSVDLRHSHEWTGLLLTLVLFLALCESLLAFLCGRTW